MASILLIDDEPKIGIIVRRILEEKGHTMIQANSGAEGLKMLESTKPDLMLVDVMMPEMDGWTLCKKIKSDTKTKHIPVVMFTIRASREDMKKSMESGADAHVNKPFEIEELLGTIERLLKKRT